MCNHLLVKKCSKPSDEEKTSGASDTRLCLAWHARLQLTPSPMRRRFEPRDLEACKQLPIHLHLLPDNTKSAGSEIIPPVIPLPSPHSSTIPPHLYTAHHGCQYVSKHDPPHEVATLTTRYRPPGNCPYVGPCSQRQNEVTENRAIRPILLSDLRLEPHRLDCSLREISAEEETRPMLNEVQRDSSMLTFESSQTQGASAITEKLVVGVPAALRRTTS